MRFKGFLFLTALAVLLGPSLGLSQFGGQPGGGFGQGGGGRGGRGGGGGGRDPGAMFDAMAKGKQAITKADVTNAFMQTMFDQVVTSSGSTNGQVTRDQWVTAMGQLQQQFGGRMGRGGAQTPGATTPAQAAAGGQATGNPFGGGQGAFGGAGAGRGGGNRGGGNNWAGGGNNNNWAGGGNNWAGGGNNWGGGRGAGGAGNWNPDTMADMRFRQLDANGDGLLNTDEMQADETLLAEHTKWDANGDGFIDQTEFREYFRARIQQLQANGPGGGMPALPGQDDNEPKPTVYRAGKLPPNLPAWFTQYDTDRDGQIGLYEWKAAGQDIARFEAMDINGDGFLTVEEVLRSPEVAQAGGRGTGGPLAMGQGTGSPGAFGQIPGAFGTGRANRGQNGFGTGQPGQNPFGTGRGNRGQNGFGTGQPGQNPFGTGRGNRGQNGFGTGQPGQNPFGTGRGGNRGQNGFGQGQQGASGQGQQGAFGQGRGNRGPGGFGRGQTPNGP